jgi:C1A family cysteine protease
MLIRQILLFHFILMFTLNKIHAQILTTEVIKPITNTSVLIKPKSILLANADLIGLPTVNNSTSYIRNQGGRGSCTMFAATAALEHFLFKAGYGNIDLSEEQMNLLSKTFWLHPDYETQVKPFDANRTENQLGITQGGSQIPIMVNGMYTCTENNLPYQSYVSYPANITNDNFWNSQFAINKINFNLVNYLPKVLQSDYYRATSYEKLKKSNDPNEIENVLINGNVIVWEAIIKGNIKLPIWDAKPTDSNSIGGHAMLIVGFDKTDSDINKHFFWVKNSWGPTQHQYGLTKISYNYIINCGVGALYITGAEKKNWPQIQFLGRWVTNANTDKNLMFDLYHIPGIIKSGFEYFNFANQKDYRFGTVYKKNASNKFDTDSKAYRLNGQYNKTNNTIEIFYNENKPNFNYDNLDKTNAKQFTFSPINYGYKLAGLSYNKNGLMEPYLLNRLEEITLRSGNFQNNASLEGNYILELADSKFRVKITNTDSILHSEIEIKDESNNNAQKVSIAFAPEMQRRLISATQRVNPEAASNIKENGIIFNFTFPNLPIQFLNEKKIFSNNNINFYQLENTSVLIGISSNGMGAILTKL